MALSILSSSHYYHNHIANKITYSKSGRKLELYYISTTFISSSSSSSSIVIYCPPHRSSPSSAITYNQQRLSSTTYKYSTEIYNLSHPYTKTTTPRRYDIQYPSSINIHLTSTILSIKYLPCHHLSQSQAI